MFAAGYVIGVDVAFGPRPAPVGWSFYTPIAALQWAAVHTVGGEITGKLYVCATLFLAALAPMVLLRRRSLAAQLAAGLLGVLNPWTYDRIAEGQLTVVIAAAMLFLWLAAWESLMERPGTRSALLLAAVSVAVLVFSKNFVLILATLAGGAVVSRRAWRRRDARRPLVVAMVAFAALSLYGWLGFFFANSNGSFATVQHVGTADIATFRSTPDGLYGLFPALLGLYGEWAERVGRFPVATSGHPWWIASSIILVAMAVVGAYRDRRHAWLLATGVVGVLVSASTATGPGRAVFEWALDHGVPLAGAYREPQKFLALWLVAVTVLVATAVDTAGLRAGVLRPAFAALAALACLLPAGVNALQSLPPILRPATYPGDWSAAAAYLDGHLPGGSRVAVLPWHQYEPLPFTGRLAMNPASVVFPGDLLVPDDLELYGETPAQRSAIARAALNPRGGCELADALRASGAHVAVIEAVVDADASLDALTRCGFSVAEGGRGLTSVLLDGRM